jgi:hypothetical protein
LCAASHDPLAIVNGRASGSSLEMTRSFQVLRPERDN